ncbi:HesA/MoeB/ThiF family protein [Nocardia sp. N2S4-5]|uniref:HesA/MoeB/ThiF family protein n=1 Tax=Nocardia sp. N2S4-5 TaxID=3351565 RepID=UPI0037CDDA83
MTERSPRHLVFTAAALDTVARIGERPIGLAMELRDDGDLGTVTGRGGHDVLVFPHEPERTATGAPVLCWSSDHGVLARRVDTGDRIDTTAAVADAGTGFERVHSALETDVLAAKSVAVLGLGSGGSFIVRELAKTGVGRFLLVDNDRLEVGNVTRHECGLSEVGRLKTNAVRDLVADRNPRADVHTSTLTIDGTTLGTLRGLIRDISADLVVCATDNRESRLLINRLCLEEQLPLLLGGVYRRAYGGIVQRVVPGVTPCYQCFVQSLPAHAADNEVSSATDAARYSYTDRQTAPQPGLSADIVPIALHMTKLALLELLDGASPAFNTLAADLVAPIHQWINRREFAHVNLEPLGVTIDEQTVLRWYGVLLQRLDDCAACGSGTRFSAESALFAG